MNKDNLTLEHSPEVIKERISGPKKHSYLADAILGGIDGCITTFAIVASAIGAGLPQTSGVFFKSVDGITRILIL